MSLQMDACKQEARIESKDHLWKPAPIVGRDFVQREVPPQEAPIPISQYGREVKNFVLPSHFSQVP